MRKIYAAAAAAVLLAVPMMGCGPGTDTGGDEEPEAQQQTRDAQEQEQQTGEKEQDDGGSGGYLGTVNKARKSAKQTAALSKLKQEIRRFRALKGRNPRSLDELKEWRGGKLPKPPTGREYRYDPDSGELTLSPSR